MKAICCFSSENFCSGVFQKIISPYREVGQHMQIALSGKVDHLAQRIFADTNELRKFQLKNLPTSERVFHFLSAVALSIPLINLVFQKFISTFPNEKMKESNQSLSVKPHPILIRDQQHPRPKNDKRIGFDKVEIREFDKDFAPNDTKGYVQHSLVDLPDAKTLGDKSTLRTHRRVRPQECSIS
jgi:hypothetical protein